jgi:hypothetical protein
LLDLNSLAQRRRGSIKEAIEASPPNRGQHLRLPENVVLSLESFLEIDWPRTLVMGATEEELMDMVVDVLRRNGSGTI